MHRHRAPCAGAAAAHSARTQRPPPRARPPLALLLLTLLPAAAAAAAPAPRRGRGGGRALLAEAREEVDFDHTLNTAGPACVGRFHSLGRELYPAGSGCPELIQQAFAATAKAMCPAGAGDVGAPLQRCLNATAVRAPATCLSQRGCAGAAHGVRASVPYPRRWRVPRTRAQAPATGARANFTGVDRRVDRVRHRMPRAAHKGAHARAEGQHGRPLVPPQVRLALGARAAAARCRARALRLCPASHAAVGRNAARLGSRAWGLPPGEAPTPTQDFREKFLDGQRVKKTKPAAASAAPPLAAESALAGAALAAAALLLA